MAIETASLLQEAGHSAICARELGLESAGDQVQLLTAAQRRCVLVTHNAKDFALLHDAWRLWSATWQVTAIHAGLLIIPQAPIWLPDRAAQELVDLVDAGVQFANELYSWHTRRGWLRRSSF